MYVWAVQNQSTTISISEAFLGAEFDDLPILTQKFKNPKFHQMDNFKYFLAFEDALKYLKYYFVLKCEGCVPISCYIHSKFIIRQN